MACDNKCGREVYCPDCYEKRRRVIQYNDEIYTAESTELAQAWLDGKITIREIKKQTSFRKIAQVQKFLCHVLRAMHQNKD